MAKSMVERARELRPIIEAAAQAGLDDDTAITAVELFPAWAIGVAYAVGAVASAALLVLCLYLTLTTGAGLFLLPGVLWLAVKGVLPNGAKPDKISCYKK